MRRQNLIFFLLAVSAAVSWWVADALAPKEVSVPRRAGHTPDSFTVGMTKTVMDDEGRPKHILVAEATRHFNDDNTTELDKPVLTVFRADSPPWVIKSESGLVTPGKDEVMLLGKVYIDREAWADGRAVNIFTTNLKVKPEIEFAETDEFVEMISPPDRTSGTGMRFFFGQPMKLTLLSKVRGKYEAR